MYLSYHNIIKYDRSVQRPPRKNGNEQNFCPNIDYDKNVLQV